MRDVLISRNATTKMLREYAEVKFACGETELANGILKAANYIEKDNIPAACDMDKVVEQLEGVLLNLTFYKDDNSKAWNRAIHKAVEIVKSGGIE